MNLKKLKEHFLNNNVQFITVHVDGVVLQSDNALFSLENGFQLHNLHPFFYSITAMLADVKDKVNYPCVNLTIDGKSKILDISVEKIEGTILVTFIDFSEHYTDSHPIVQEKNEASIQKNKLHFEHALLEAKENYKNQFIAQLNHEIRNPLNNLLGFIDILKDTSLDYQQEETLNVIQKTGRHIKYLMDDLLDISKIESGTIQIKHIAFNLYHLIKNIETHFGLKSNNSKIEFEVESAKNIPAKLMGDPLRLNQILINLVENAFRNTNEGSIKVLFDYDIISKSKMQLTVHIKDTGVGIPNDKISKVFDSYYRLKLDEVKPIGQGLGLKIVKDLTELLNGTVTVKSEENKGTHFILSLPFELRSNETKKKTVPKGSGIVISKRILVVEDEEINQMLFMKNFLNNDKGFHIEISNNEEDTLKRLLKKTYYAVILKSRLNNKNTVDLLKSIRNSLIQNVSHVPILVVTGKTMLEQQDAFLNNGATDFLAKPYNKTQLFKKLELIQEQ